MEPHLGELAYHFYEAAPAGEAEKAAVYASHAAQRALAALGFEEAARLFRLALRALELTGAFDAGQATTDVLGLGESLARAGDVTGARASFLRAAELARASGDAEALATAALGVGGRFAWGRNSDPELVPLLQEALAARARGGGLDPSCAGAGADRGRPAQRGLARAAQLVQRRCRRGRPPAWRPRGARRHGGGALERDLVGREPRRAARAGQRSCSRWRRPRATASASSRGISNAPRPCTSSDADLEIELAGEVADQLGQPAQKWAIALHRGMRAHSEGRFAEAEELSFAAFARGADAVGADAIVGHQIQLALLRREQGRLAEIEPGLASAAAQHRRRPPLRCLLVLTHAILGRTDDARRALGEIALEGLPRDNEWLLGMSSLAEACALLGAVEHADRLYGELLPFADRTAADIDEAASARSSAHSACWRGWRAARTTPSPTCGPPSSTTRRSATGRGRPGRCSRSASTKPRAAIAAELGMTTLLDA